MVMPGKAHRWNTEPMEVKVVEEWFDKHHLETLKCADVNLFAIRFHEARASLLCLFITCPS